MIPFPVKATLSPVTEATMQALYDRLKTPVKQGAVIRWPAHFTDSPTVFYKDGRYYMYFIAISKDVHISGYETHLAYSTDLRHWEYQGPVFRRNDQDRWDSKQCAGYAAFVDPAWESGGAICPVNGRYYLSYLAGNSDGYEPDPLFMGLAHNADPTDADGFVRLPSPILRPDDPDTRPFETCTLYKSSLFEDPHRRTGHPYVNVYNAKGEDQRERIFLAVSDDAVHWERWGDRAVLDLIGDDPDELIAGDPQILCVDDLYVMLFFRYRAGKPAYNTFAASRDLIHWQVWEGKPLVESEHAWEDVHAHKSWFVRANGVNHHFYCAVNSQNERFIALATSE
ncbi:MAG: glycosylase [Clostridia bacterium]|nr:glycosylase [Clostridia bacterium]